MTSIAVTAAVMGAYALACKTTTEPDPINVVAPAAGFALLVHSLHSLSPGIARSAAALSIPLALQAYASYQHTTTPTFLLKYSLLPAFGGAGVVIAHLLLPALFGEVLSVSGLAAAALTGVHLVRVVTFLVKCMLLPAPIVADVLIGASHLTRMRDAIPAAHPGAELVMIPVPTAPGAVPVPGCVVLDAVVLSRSTGRSLGSGAHVPVKRWVIYFGGNGEVFEAGLDGPARLAHRLDANLFMFNSRGIARSTGTTTSSDDLLADARAAVDYLFERYHPDPTQVLLVGHSLGGGVASTLAATYPPLAQAPVLLDRTFSSLLDAAIALSPIQHPGLVRFALPKIFGDFDVVSNWQAIPHSRKLCVFHADDQIIRFSSCSLARDPSKLQQGQQQAPQGGRGGLILKLEGKAQDPHNSEFGVFANFETDILPRIVQLFEKS